MSSVSSYHLNLAFFLFAEIKAEHEVMLQVNSTAQIVAKICWVSAAEYSQLFKTKSNNLNIPQQWYSWLGIKMF